MATDLQELFARDPLLHTKESIDEIIADLRSRRSQFNLENNKKAGNLKAPKAAKPTALGLLGLSLDLSVLDKKDEAK